MIVLFIGIPLTNLAGIEQAIFKYSQGPGFSYSDMNGYGSDLNRYYIYKFYWLCLGIIFYILTLLFYNRGYVSSAVEKFKIAKNRLRGVIPFFISVFTILFISIPTPIYNQNECIYLSFILSQKLRHYVSVRRQSNRFKLRTSNVICYGFEAQTDLVGFYGGP